MTKDDYSIDFGRGYGNLGCLNSDTCQNLRLLTQNLEDEFQVTCTGLYVLVY